MHGMLGKYQTDIKVIYILNSSVWLNNEKYFDFANPSDGIFTWNLIMKTLRSNCKK